MGPSVCVGNAYRKYYLHGVVPDSNETDCPGDLEIFPSGQVQTDPVTEEEEEMRRLVLNLGQAMRKWAGLSLSG